jgi:hypothetical protein
MTFPDFFGPTRMSEELFAADTVICFERRLLHRGASRALWSSQGATLLGQQWSASGFCVAQPVVSHHRNPEAVSLPPPSMFRCGALCNDFVYRRVSGAHPSRAH